jgi:uncharacterized membrane protein YgcG
MTIHSRVAMLVRTAATIIALVAPAGGYAQGNAPAANTNLKDGRWQPWLGCWSPVERAPRDRDIQVCITPDADTRSVRLTTFAGDQRILEDSILADGSTQTMHEDGCRGSTRSQWARNAARLFRVTELDCDGKPLQRTSEIAGLENADEWLDVQVIITGASDNVRTRHYVRSAMTPPSEVRDRVNGLPTGAVAVNAAVSVDDVIEANGIVSPRAVEAWLSEANVQVPVHKRTLLALHDAKVPANVIDLMIARAYPAHFEVHTSGGGGSAESFFDDMEWSSPFDLMFDPYAFYYSPFGSYHRYVDPSFYPLGGYIIVPTPAGGAAQDTGNARVVNGAGYTRVEPRQPPVIVGPRPPGSSADSYDSGSSSSSSGSSSSSSGGGSASAAGYSAGGGGAQTAVPR